MANTNRSVKRDFQGRPHVTDASGHVMLNVADYDGSLKIGTGEEQFDTIWQSLGPNEVRVYNDGANIAGVAVVRGATAWTDLTEAFLKELNYTSRHRVVSAGDVVVYENTSGRFLVIMFNELAVVNQDEHLMDVDYYMHGPASATARGGQGGRTFSGNLTTGSPPAAVSADSQIITVDSTLVTADGAILTVNGAVLSMLDNAIDAVPHGDDDAFELYGPQIRQGATEIEAALADLIGMFNSKDEAEEHGGRGHNQPPPDLFVDPSAKQETFEALQILKDLDVSDADNRRMITQAGNVLLGVAKSLLTWIEPRFNKFVDSFSEAAGKTLGSKSAILGLAFLATGKLTTIIDLVNRVIVAFPG